MISKLIGVQGTTMKMVTIKDVGHSMFSDASLLLNMTLFGRLVSRYAFFELEVPAGKAANILTTQVMLNIVNFFDEQLKDKG